MSEFIGSRISLVSNSDIRYVGTLHEINSAKSTVALENVTSFGTEGRKSNPEEEIPPSDSVYEYIIFRGTDVKDLRIEQAPTTKENAPPQVPNDPAILGNARPQQAQPGSSRPNQQQGPQQQGPAPPGAPGFGQHPQYPPPYFPPPPTGWGRGAPPGPGYPGMPYGVAAPWYPPPGQGFPHPPGPFPPYGYPQGPPGQQFPQGQGKPAPIGPGANRQTPPAGPAADKQAEPKSLAKPAAELATTSASKVSDQKPLTVPVESKSSAGEVKASVPQQSTSHIAATATTSRTAPTGPKNGRIQPAVPLQSSAAVKTTPQVNSGNEAQPAPAPTLASLRDATQAATAAVAAAMAKLPPTGSQQANGNAVDNITKKVNELKTNDPIRAPRQPGAGGFPPRGGRGRGGPRETRKVEVPTTDFDFESSNAKFNKQDLVKEAIAGSPHGETAPSSSGADVDDESNKSEAPVVGYNKATSFFDNISSESKDRAEAGSGKVGGREWRGEEQKKNLETFGQGSVDNGYRGGYRGRGRGRGGRGRGYTNTNGGPRARGGHRSGRGDPQMIAR